MSSGNLLTVIIPTRAAGAHIDDCLESLRRQTFQQFEVCIIDAQSADDTVKKVQAFAGKLGVALQCRSEPDSGVYDAMNKGIEHSTGEWLYFLGADDVMHDAEVFADVAKVLASSDADIVYGDEIKKSSGVRYGGEFTLDRLLFECNVCHQAVFYRRSLFDKLGGYNLRYPIWADWEFNIRCFRHPDMRPRWMDRVIAVYNDASGISREEDPVFRKELPVFLLRETRRLEKELARGCIRNFASRLYGIFAGRRS
jgi:glycosyltransferase involved in cell wall biosynthesis